MERLKKKSLFEYMNYSFFYILLISPFISYIVLINGRTAYMFWALVSVIFCLASLLLIKNLYIPPILYFIFASIIYLLSRSIFSPLLSNISIAHYLFKYLEIQIFLIILIIYNTEFDEIFIKMVIRIIELLILLTIITSFIQVYNYSFFNPYYGTEFSLISQSMINSRRSSIFGSYDRNEMGLSFIPLLSLYIGFSIKEKHKFGLFYILLSSIPIFLSNTRYIILGYLIIMTQFLFVNISFKNIFKYIFLSFLIVILSLVVLKYLDYPIQVWLEDRLFSEGSNNSRIYLMRIFLKEFPKNPIFGNGEFISADILNATGGLYIHNGFMSYLLSFGLVGFLPIFGFYMALLVNMFLIGKKTNYWGSFFAILSFIMSNFTLTRLSIFFPGLIYAFIFNRYYQNKSNYVK